MWFRRQMPAQGRGGSDPPFHALATLPSICRLSAGGARSRTRRGSDAVADSCCTLTWPSKITSQSPSTGTTITAWPSMPWYCSPSCGAVRPPWETCKGEGYLCACVRFPHARAYAAPWLLVTLPCPTGQPEGAGKGPCRGRSVQDCQEHPPGDRFRGCEPGRRPDEARRWQPGCDQSVCREHCRAIREEAGCILLGGSILLCQVLIWVGS